MRQLFHLITAFALAGCAASSQAKPHDIRQSDILSGSSTVASGCIDPATAKPQ
jgi:uncharacterized protein YcfL